jgi:predicted aldo/keto reductase-like oxidoreductase
VGQGSREKDKEQIRTMQYRRFGKLDWKGSALGFGCMRLPTTSDREEDIDEALATRMIRHAIDEGVNYVDTAYPYHGGNSEKVVGRILGDGYRGRVKLATKMPCWLVESPADFDKYLDEQLERLRTEHVDFYLLHALWEDRWERMRGMKVFEWAEGAVADGRIGHLGFSFHGPLQLFKEIIDSYDWTMCQIQYNFMNEDIQAGTEGLEYAASKGVAVVIMEPLLGGLLAEPPGEVQEIWEDAGTSPADAALRWLWNKPQVSVVLSGMSAMKHVEENLASADRSGVGTLIDQELELVARVRDAYESFASIPCTKCGYCMPCPNGVNIPRNFELYNQAVMHGNATLSKALYNWHMLEGERAAACIACRECEEKCPQQIEISEWMPKVQDYLAIKDSE